MAAPLKRANSGEPSLVPETVQMTTVKTAEPTTVKPAIDRPKISLQQV